MNTQRSRAIAAMLLAFGLFSCTSSGGAPPETAPAPAPDARLVAQGDSLFNNGACVRCHARAGVGGANGPSLASGQWLHADGSLPSLVRVITAGVPRDSLRDTSRRFPMNPRGGPMNLTDPQVSALAAYVWSISRAKQQRPSP